MSTEQVAAGKNLVVRTIRALAEEAGITISVIEWMTVDTADPAVLRVKALGVSLEKYFDRAWLEDLPSGTYSRRLDAVIAELVASLRASEVEEH